MHSAGLELTKLTHTRLEDNLIRHRGDRLLMDCDCLVYSVSQQSVNTEFVRTWYPSGVKRRISTDSRRTDDWCRWVEITVSCEGNTTHIHTLARGMVFAVSSYSKQPDNSSIIQVEIFLKNEKICKYVVTTSVRHRFWLFFGRFIERSNANLQIFWFPRGRCGIWWDGMGWALIIWGLGGSAFVRPVAGPRSQESIFFFFLVFTAVLYPMTVGCPVRCRRRYNDGNDDKQANGPPWWLERSRLPSSVMPYTECRTHHHQVTPRNNYVTEMRQRRQYAAVHWCRRIASLFWERLRFALTSGR